ncbi:MAG: HIT family protein [Verrucomicrobiota bacterium]
MSERLHPHWRMRYVTAPKAASEGSLFASLLASGDDRASLIVHRGPACFVIMNAYPYAPGHLMVLPNREVGELSELTAAERAEIMDLLVRCQAVLTAVMKPAGFNVGLNVGRVAGAGLPGHLHFHVVPRWEGDHNFMPVVADTRLLSQSLSDLWEKFVAAFKA